ncbi:MAG: chromate transporter [Treponema sp.]|jgi:chromate transporter|nr:chromate transporter [Treponema sp.]
MNLLSLAAEFCKIGLFSVGGGPATLPFFFALAKKDNPLSPEKIGDFLAVAQSAPGAMGVNMAAQTGFLLAGIPGACVAALSLAAPSVAIIIVIARTLESFRKNRAVAAVFSGLRPAAAGLLAAAGLGIWRLSLLDLSVPGLAGLFRWKEWLLFGLFFFSIYKLKGHPVIYIAIAAALGVILEL